MKTAKTKKKKSKLMLFLIIAVSSVVFFGLCFWLGNLYVISYAKDSIKTVAEAASFDADCILVLGCKVTDDTPSEMLEHRLMTGIELYKAGAAPKLLMSGDHGRTTYDEVYAMKKYALDSGIGGDDVFCDHAGFSTYESLYRAKEIFGCKKVIVVTQEFHISRAVFLGKSLGLDVIGVTCDRGVYVKEKANAKRESMARIKAIFTAVIKPKPTYLGEPIPIWGSGSVTDDKVFE